MKLPKTVSISDFHCVEGWSVVDCKWEGVHIREIEKLVKPKDVAKAVTFECADSYTTSLFREELYGDDVLLAYKLNERSVGGRVGFSSAPRSSKQVCVQKRVVGGAFAVYPRQRVRFLGATRIQ